MNVFICSESQKEIEDIRQNLYSFSKKYKVGLKVFTSRKYDKGVLEKLRLVRLELAVIDIDSKQEKMQAFIASLKNSNSLACFLFLTKTPEMVWRSLEFYAFGFLAKPLDKMKFENLFKMVLIQMAGIKAIRRQCVPKTIQFVAGRANYVLKEDEILYLKREGSGVTIQTEAGEAYIVYETLRNLFQRLSNSFLTINRGIVVNKKHITKIAGKYAIMTDNKSLPISTRNYKQILKEFTAMYSQMIDEQLILHNEKVEK